MTALKTTSLRLRGTSVDILNDEGLDSDGAVTSKSKLQSKVKALSGVDILTETGEYKSTYEILSQIADVWEDINDMDQAALLELISGKRNSSVIAAILQNPKELKEAFEDAQNAEGSALRENEKYLDSIQGRIDLFTNALQTMWSAELDSEWIKGIVDIGTALIKVVDTLGLIPSILVAIGASQFIPWLLKTATGMSTLGQSLQYLGMMMTSINGTGAALIPTIVAQTKAMLASSAGANIFSLSLKTLGVVLKSLMATPLGWFLAIGAAIALTVHLIDVFTTTTEELQDKLDGLKSELSDATSELESVNTELETTQERMAELQAMDKLSFTEEEELKRLQKENEELQRRADLLALEQKVKAKEAGATFNQLMSDDVNAYGEYYDDGSKATFWSELGYILSGSYGTVTHQTSKATEADIIEQSLKDYQTYTNRLNEIDRALIAAYENADAEAIARLEADKQEIAATMSDLSTYLLDKNTEFTNAAEGIDYGIDDTTDAWLDYINNFQNRLMMTMGGKNAVTNALNNVFNRGTYAGVSEEIDRLVAKLERDPGNQTYLSQIRDQVKLAEDDLIASGLSVDQAFAYFTQQGSNEIVDNSSILDSLTNISKLEEAYNSLGSAIKEFKESGTVASGTLEGLKESFGTVDGFEELYKVLATGEGDVETAIANVANAYINQKDILANLTDEELNIMAQRLKALGVINAEEIIQSRQVAQEKLNTSYQLYSMDLSNYATAEEAKIAIALQAGLDLSQINDENMNDLAEQYGIDLSNYATAMEQKIAIARAVALETAEVNKEAALAALDPKSSTYTVDKNRILRTYRDTIGSIPTDQVFGGISSIVDEYFSKSFTFDFNGQVGIGRDFDEDLTEKATQELEDRWAKLVGEYENKLALITNQRDRIEAEIDKAEARESKASQQYYHDLLDNSSAEKALLQEKYDALQAYINANQNLIDQDTWTEYNNELNEVAIAIKECEINTIEWEEALREIDIHYFEQTTDEISRLGEEIEFVQSLLEDEEVADENGNWSSAALTRLGLYTQQLEKAAAEAKLYQDEINKLNAEKDAGKLSDEQYQERLSDLVSGQQDAIQAYEDAKDSIVELNEARIDAIKDGIDKEIEAYEDLIDLKKKELDAERDLYDFRKNVQNQTKDIANLERRIAALSGSTNASDVAQRKKLEAELLEAREGLNDTYYEHSRDQQSQALDDEAEAFSKSKEQYIETLEAQLKDTQTLIQNSLMDVLLNADSIYAQLNSVANTYGITLSDSLTQPWQNASAQAIEWKNELQESMTAGDYAALIGEGGAITAFANGVATKLVGSWSTAQNAVKDYSDFLTSAELGNNFGKTITGFGDQIQTIIDKWNGVRDAANKAYEAQTRETTVGGNPNSGSQSSNGGDNGGGNSGGSTDSTETSAKESVKALQEVLNIVFGAGIATDGVLGPATEAALKKAQQKMGITADGIYGEKTRQAMLNHIDKEINNMKRMGGSSMIGQAVQAFLDAKKKVPFAFVTGGSHSSTSGGGGGVFSKIMKYASGTMGTKSNQLALTDEIGDELVLVPTANGNLSFMRKGTSVIPADLTANLVKWGQLNPDMMNTPNPNANINLMNSYISKPELNISFDALVKAERITEDTLPKVQQLVTQELNKFTKQLNYALKVKGAN